MQPLSDSDIQRAEALLERGEPGQALECLRAALAAGVTNARVLIAAGRAYNNLGRLDEAIDAFRRAAAVAPESADVLASLGHVLARGGDSAAAEEAWRRALAHAPDHLRALRGLSGLCAASRRYEEAAALLRRATALAPGDPDGWLNLAELGQFLDSPAEAEAAYQRAAALAPGRFEIHAGLGRLRYANGDAAGAERAYARALALDPGHADAAAGRALCLEILGRREEGIGLLRPFLHDGAAPPMVEFAAGRLLAAAGRDEEAAVHLGRATGARDPLWRRNPRPWYDYGRVLEKLGRPEAAFDAWDEANRLKPTDFDATAFAARVDAILAGYAGEHDLAAGAASAEGRPRPLFIVGMPRSGTTLIEQMLACHPAVEAGGERLILEAMAGRLWREQARVRPADETARRALRRQWLERVGPVASARVFYTDKYPANFLHLGLARELLPELAVVWCRRDPADTALSIYATDFNRRIVPWATRLEDIAAVWRAQERLMRHWRDVLDLPVTEISYESLVADPAGELRRLLDALGLPWEAGCLRFHESGRLANTASFDQVRRPLYGSSVGRARRFGARLEPFLRALAS